MYSNITLLRRINCAAYLKEVSFRKLNPCARLLRTNSVGDPSVGARCDLLAGECVGWTQIKLFLRSVKLKLALRELLYCLIIPPTINVT